MEDDTFEPKEIQGPAAKRNVMNSPTIDEPGPACFGASDIAIVESPAKQSQRPVFDIQTIVLVENRECLKPKGDDQQQHSHGSRYTGDYGLVASQHPCHAKGDDRHQEKQELNRRSLFVKVRHSSDLVAVD